MKLTNHIRALLSLLHPSNYQEFSCQADTLTCMMASLWAWLRVCGFFKLHMRNLTEQVAINPYTPKMELFACDYVLTHTSFSTNIIPHGYSNQTTEASTFGCHLIHTGVGPYSRCRCWFGRSVGSCGSFGLCATAPRGLRSDHRCSPMSPSSWEEGLIPNQYPSY